MTPELTVETTAAATLAGQEGAMNYDTAARDDAARAGASAVLRGDGPPPSVMQEGSMTEAPAEWCWMDDGSERCHGPFATREDAMDDALDNGRDVVLVGHVQRYDGSEYMPGVDRILEIVNEDAVDGDFSWLDEDAFELRVGADEDDASEELTAWARKWLRCDRWTCAYEMERVDLRETDGDEATS